MDQRSSTITITGGSISTTGCGANGGFASGTGSSLTLKDVTITATADGGHGVMVIADTTMTSDSDKWGVMIYQSMSVTPQVRRARLRFPAARWQRRARARRRSM